MPAVAPGFTQTVCPELWRHSRSLLYRLLVVWPASGGADEVTRLTKKDSSLVYSNILRLQILAVKSSTYFLGDVPELHSLVENMTSLELAHFSRVLALLVFEPEYRQLMESAHVLRYEEVGCVGCAANRE